MKRRIVDYRQTRPDYWMAVLDCGHELSLRHKPPFMVRPWVRTERGRQEHLGKTMNCGSCDRLEWPPNLTSLRRTPEFSATNFPAGLARDHATKEGVWGLLHILQGKLLYVVQEPEVKQLPLAEGDKGVIPPTMLHHIKVDSDVRFFVEFFTLQSAPQKAVDHVKLLD